MRFSWGWPMPLYLLSWRSSMCNISFTITSWCGTIKSHVLIFLSIEQKFYLDQNALNKIYELMFFDIGYEYTYVISLYLWTCFFMPLQPIVIVFSIAGLFLNYWAQKYCLFNRCKRPVPGTRVLYNVMMQFVYAGGLFYSFGSLTFINFIPKSLLFTELKFALIANIISIIIAGISLFIPYSYIFGKLFEKK